MLSFSVNSGSQKALDSLHTKADRCTSHYFYRLLISISVLARVEYTHAQDFQVPDLIPREFSQYSTTPTNHEKIIRIATGEYPPYITKDKSCVIAIVDAAFHAHGYKTQYVFYPWERTFDLVERGKHSASLLWNNRGDRRKRVIYSSNHVSKESYFFIYRKEKNFDWTDYNDLVEKRIIILRGYTYTQPFYSALEKFNVKTIVAENEDQGIQMLIGQRADIMLISKKVFHYKHQRLPTIEQILLKMHPQPVFSQVGHVVFSRNNTEGEKLKNIFDTGFEKVLDDPHFNKARLDCSW